LLVYLPDGSTVASGAFRDALKPTIPAKVRLTRMRYSQSSITKNRQEHRQREKRAYAQHLGNPARRAPEERRSRNPHREAHAPQVPRDPDGDPRRAT
jgi:hypothetical protein